MDEEEQQQSDSKISVSSFFERVDSVDKVANSALSKANANLSIINNQKALINSINVSIEALETKVRDIANFIIIEKKLEKDAEEDRRFEQQDEDQKSSMLERLAGLKSNNESEQTQAAGGEGEEPKKGGGILGTLLTLGIGAFALKFLWPVILPAVGGLLKGALAKFAMFSIGGIGTLLKGMLVGSGLTGIGFLSIGKQFEKFGDSTEDTFKNAGESAAKKIKDFKFNEKGEVSGAEGGLGSEGGGEGGGEGNTEKENLVNGDKSMTTTLENKDLIEKNESTYKTEYVSKEGGKNLEGKNKLDNILRKEIKKVEKDIEIQGSTDALEKKLFTLEEARDNLITGDSENEFGGNDYLLNLIEKENIEYNPQENIRKIEEIKPVVENEKLDLSLSETFSDKLEPLNNQIDTLSEDFTGSINAEQGQMFSRPANSPNTTVTVFKETSSNSPFTDLMKNNYLSLNKTQQAKLLRYIK